MKKFLIAAAALAVPAVASATDAPAQPAYDYHASLTDKGVIVLEGDEAATGRRFRFKVFSNGAVTGKVGQNQVRYSVEKSMRDRLVERLRQQAASSDATAGPAS